MVTKYYEGNHSLGIGYPFVILSFVKTEKGHWLETLILFRGFDNNNLVTGDITKYDNVEGFTDEEAIEIHLDKIKDDILYNIIYKYYPSQVEKTGNLEVKLREVNDRMLAFLRYKYNSDLTTIRQITANQERKSRIDVYRRVHINVGPMDIENSRFEKARKTDQTS